MMSEFNALERILAYVAENRLKAAIKAEVKHMDVEANEIKIFDVGQRKNIELKPPDEPRSIRMEDSGVEG